MSLQNQLYIDLGSKLRELREASGLTQAQLAKHAGVSRVTIVRYEKGFISKLDELERIVQSVAEDLSLRVILVDDESSEDYVIMADGSPLSSEAQEAARIVEALTPEQRAQVLGLVHGYTAARGFVTK